MKKKIPFLLFLFVINSMALIGQIPIVQVEGYLESYIHLDTTTTYVGLNSGQLTDFTLQVRNSFFGTDAGKSNTRGFSNSFFGYRAGFSTTLGQENTFIGENAGRMNSTGFSNSFVGYYSGSSNTEGDQNTFFGMFSGNDTNTGNLNTFLGYSAGYENTTGTHNTVVGAFADVATSNLEYATAIGAGSEVSTNNTVVLGRAIDLVKVPGELVVDKKIVIQGIDKDTGIYSIVGGSTAQVYGGHFTGIGTHAKGIYVETSGTASDANAILARSGGGSSYAGYFDGRVNVTGTLSKGSGSFKIDHPLDPANKYLYHSFVESPDMMNIYNGNVTTDQEGYAIVSLPKYFDALNRDFRYQLTVIGSFAQAIIAKEVANNQFVIQTDKPNIQVSWQVTGIRNDAFARKHPIITEVDKGEHRGRYVHPEVFSLPDELKINITRGINP